MKIFLIGHFFQTGTPVHEMIVTQLGTVRLGLLARKVQ